MNMVGLLPPHSLLGRDYRIFFFNRIPLSPYHPVKSHSSRLSLREVLLAHNSQGHPGDLGVTVNRVAAATPIRTLSATPKCPGTAPNGPARPDRKFPVG